MIGDGGRIELGQDFTGYQRARQTMRRLKHVLLGICVLAAGAVRGAAGADSSETVLPAGVKAVWDLDKAFRETTGSRERICINGLWRWQPAGKKAEQVPADGWGYFKVPGCWPGITDYMQDDCQTVYPHPSWKGQKPAGITAAWYQREISVPQEWAGRRIKLDVRSTSIPTPRSTWTARTRRDSLPRGRARSHLGLPARAASHLLSLLVVAMPPEAVMLMFNDTNAAKEAQGSVARRGLCGDVYLAGTPAAARIGDVRDRHFGPQGRDHASCTALRGPGAGFRDTGCTPTIADHGRNVARVHEPGV